MEDEKALKEPGSQNTSTPEETESFHTHSPQETSQPQESVQQNTQNEDQLSQQAVNPTQPANQVAEPLSSEIASVDNSMSDRQEIKPAGMRFRLSAFFIDGLITSVPVAIIYLLIFLLKENIFLYQKPFIQIPLTILYAAWLSFYYVYFNVKSGSTPGKNVYGLKVVNSDTLQLLGAKKALLRELVAKTSYTVPLLGPIFQIVNGFVLIFSKEKKAIHDNVAGSKVLIVKKRWSILKQLGLVLVLFLVILLPFVIMLPRFFNQANNINQCTIECVNDYEIENIDPAQQQEILLNCQQNCLEQ